jgi:hypothetical protein
MLAPRAAIRSDEQLAESTVAPERMTKHDGRLG